LCFLSVLRLFGLKTEDVTGVCKKRIMRGRNFGHFSPNTFVAVSKSVLCRAVGRMFYVKLRVYVK